MTIIGLDPGIARTGFGIIDTGTPSLFVQCGCLTTKPETPATVRLQEIADDLASLIKEHHPEQAVVEEVFFGTNTTTAIQTAQVRGVLLYVLQRHNVSISSLTPLQIKSRLTGYGRATKEQVQSMVAKQLKLAKIPQPDDAADALAAALCLVDN